MAFTRKIAVALLSVLALHGSAAAATLARNVLFRETFEDAVQMTSTSRTQTPQWTVADPSQFLTPGLPARAAHGRLCAGTKFDSVYDDSAEDLLYTPEIDFTGKMHTTLTFKAFYELETYSHAGTVFAADGVRLLATPDQGQTWLLLTPSGGYPFDSVRAFTDAQGQTTPGFSGSTAHWKRYRVDLGPLILQSPKWIIAWEFASDSSVGKAGFFLDDIKVTAR